MHGNNEARILNKISFLSRDCYGWVWFDNGYRQAKGRKMGAIHKRLLQQRFSLKTSIVHLLLKFNILVNRVFSSCRATQ